MDLKSYNINNRGEEGFKSLFAKVKRYWRLCGLRETIMFGVQWPYCRQTSSTITLYTPKGILKVHRLALESTAIQRFHPTKYSCCWSVYQIDFLHLFWCFLLVMLFNVQSLTDIWVTFFRAYFFFEYRIAEY